MQSLADHCPFGRLAPRAADAWPCLEHCPKGRVTLTNRTADVKPTKLHPNKDRSKCRADECENDDENGADASE